MTNAVIYARYSSDKQNEMSIEGQIAECRKYAEEHEITVVQEYVDRALSATTDRRPNFLRMIDDSRHGHFEIILVYQFDRFARSRNDSGYYKKILADNGVKVVSAKEQIAEDSSGVLTEGLLEIFGEYFSAQLSEKVSRGMYQNAEKCKYNGGTMTFGYAVNDDGYYIPDERNAPIVQEIFQRVSDGETIKSIMDELNERGIRTSKGNRFSRTSFQKMLRSEKYKGVYIYNDVRIPDGMPRLVSDEMYDMVQAVLDRRTHDRRPAEEDFILTGKLYCGHCKTQMMGTSGTSHTGKRHKYYTCANARNRGGDCKKKNIKKHIIENSVLERCREALNDEIINAVVEFVTEQNKSDQNSPEFIRITKEIQDAEIKIEKLLDQIEAGVNSERIAERLAVREEELERLKRNLTEEMKKQRRIDPQITRSFLLSMKNGKYNDNDKFKKVFIQLFVDKIYLYDDHYEILLTTADKIGGVSKDTEKVVVSELNAPGSQMTNCSVPEFEP